jgi:hypothetical protein
MKVDEYKIGNTKIEIYDDAFKEDTKNILLRVTNIAIRGLENASRKDSRSSLRV